MLSKKISLQPGKLNAKTLWYSFNPQYQINKPDVKNTSVMLRVIHQAIGWEVIMEIKRGRFKGKKVVFATSSRIDAIRELADAFMFEVFDFDAGEYLISDESSLLDFTEIGSGDTSKLWQNISSRYGVDAGDVSSDKIVDILYEIHSRRNQH